MFIDARTISKNTVIETDVCIIGAGAAGITLARELTEQPFKVSLLESGGLEFESDTQSLYRGESVGLPYFPLEAARLRYFGGTTNHWGGASRPLDSIDFQARDWVSESGWPFARAHLLPFYERAQSVLQLGPFVYEGDAWETEERPRAVFNGGTLTSVVLQQSPPTRFGQVYRESIRKASNVDTYLHANVLEIETNESARSATRVRVSALDKNEFFVSARVFVIATGGIENARLLLLSDRFARGGLGNTHGLVGRYFMDHPIAPWGKAGIIAPSGFPLPFYAERNEGEITSGGTTEKATFWGFIMPSAKTLRRERMLGFGFAVRAVPPALDSEPGVESARHIKRALGRGEWPDNFWEHVGTVASDFDSVTFLGCKELTGQSLLTVIEIMYWAEPYPNLDSRVSLSGKRDAFGQRRVRLNWRLTERDKRNMARALEILAGELGRSGLGRLGANPAVWGDDWQSLLEGSYHHMGTTRMHREATRGVVDPNCRVHGVSNVYLAGSSVFPTSGHSNPTLTIVALALRLADHIKQQIK